MNAFLTWLQALCFAHKMWAGPLFGLLAFGESTAVLGIVIPATPVLFLFGTLLGSGRLSAAIVPWAIAGAIGGYWLSWAVGRRIGSSPFRFPLLRRYRKGVATARLFFRRWGAPSLVFGRYILGPFQSMLPLAAGMAAMSARRFHAWNIVSSVTWVFVVLTPGYCAGHGMLLFQLSGSQQGILIGAMVLVSVGGVLAALFLGGFRLLRAAVARRSR